MAGSSSSAAVSLLPVIRHDVFLNFRGEDTRDNFISHIYAELQRNKIETYIDYRLARGEEISPALHKAIEESMIYVVVFSHQIIHKTTLNIIHSVNSGLATAWDTQYFCWDTSRF